MKSLRLSLIGVTALLLVTSGPLWAIPDSDNCQWCDRVAKLAEFVNVHAPNLEEELSAYGECLDSVVPPDQWGMDDDAMDNAHDQCSDLDVKYDDWMHLGTINTFLASYLTTDCFGMISHHADPTNYLPPDYFFTGSFEIDLKEKLLTPETPTHSGGHPAKSRMILNLYYDAEPRELVRSWTTLSTINSSLSHYNKMFRNKSSLMKQSRPFQEILWDFEKTPRSCEIEKPPGNEVFPGETIELDITRFRDQIDRKSREFNRVIVKAEKGEILNGAEAGVLESRKAFKIGDGVVTIEYEAPNECGHDTILVYNSCDINNKLPLAASTHKDVIGQLNVDVACYDLTLTVTKTDSITGYKEEVTAPRGWKKKMRSLDKRDIEKATVIMGLQFDHVADMWLIGELWAYYKPKKVRLSSFSVDLMNKSYIYSNDLHDDGFEQTVKNTGSISGGKKVETPRVEPVVLIYDRETKKPKRVVIVIHDIRYELDKTWQLNSRNWGSDNPPPPRDEKKTSISNEKFQLGPVSNSSTDPTTDMEIYPDFDITSGDGVSTFGGEGSNRYTYACHTWPDACDHDETYRWKLTRTRKKGK